LRFAIQDAFFSILLYAQAPIPKALVDAKTAYLVDDGAGAGRMDDLAKELTQWGRFTLVDSVEASDGTIRFGGFVVFKGWGITVTNSRDGRHSGAAHRGKASSRTESRPIS
jgi:hypothetical protein